MAKREPRILRDGLLNALGGMDSGRSPSIIDTNQVALAVNVIMRGGFPENRPGYDKHELTFEDAEQQAWFQDHTLQGGRVYRSSNLKNFIVASAGGRLFKIEPLNNYVVTDMTPTASTTTTANFTVPAVGGMVAVTVADGSQINVGYPLKIKGKKYQLLSRTGNVLMVENIDDTPAAVIAWPADVLFLDVNDPTRCRVWFEQAKQWLVIQNGLDRAILFDGGQSRRSITSGTATPEVPVGTVMVYSGLRLWVATKGNMIAAGDIAGGPTDVINFTEELQGLIVPARFQVDDVVTALVQGTNIDTSLGQGPIQVFTRNSAHSINVPLIRSLWSGQNYPINTVSLSHNGALSQYSTIQVNSDLHYRGPDGWRSFVLARREDTEWGNVPISTEMEAVLNDDSPDLLWAGSAILINNRVIFTANPRNSNNGVYHKCLVAFDLDPISRMGQKGRPAYDGFWTGINTTLLLQGEFNGMERGFVFALSPTGKNELWEIDAKKNEDFGAPIESMIETRALGFGNPLDMVNLASTELWIDRVKGVVNFNLQWRPDQSPCVYDWGVKELCSTVEDCDQNTDDCKAVKNYRPGYRTRLGFGQPPDSQCEPQTNRPTRTGFEHAIRLTWTGHARIRKLIAKAEIVEEDVFAACDD